MDAALPSWQVPAGELSRLEVTRPGSPPVRIDRSVAGWNIVSPIAYGAHQEAVDSMIAVLDEIETVRRVSTRPTGQHLLAPESAIAVRAWVGETVAREFLVGASTADETFVKLADDDQVFAARGRIRPIFDKPLDRLRDPVITDVPIAHVERVVYANKGGRIELVADPANAGRFIERRPRLRNFHGDRARANVAVLARLRAKGFVDGDTNQAASGLFDRDTATATLWIRGRSEPLTVWIGSQTSDRQLHLRTSASASEQIYLVSSHLASSLIVHRRHLEQTDRQLARLRESPPVGESQDDAEPSSHEHKHGSEGPPGHIPAEIMTELRQLAAQQRRN